MDNGGADPLLNMWRYVDKTELQHGIIVTVFAVAELLSLQFLSNPALSLADEIVAFFKPEVISTCHRNLSNLS